MICSNDRPAGPVVGGVADVADGAVVWACTREISIASIMLLTMRSRVGTRWLRPRIRLRVICAFRRGSAISAIIGPTRRKITGGGGSGRNLRVVWSFPILRPLVLTELR